MTRIIVSVSLDKGDEEEAERDQIRQERHKERQRAAALQRAGGDKKWLFILMLVDLLTTTLFSRRPKERDISEQIALGVQTGGNAGVQYDTRLFNTTAVIFRTSIDYRIINSASIV